MTKQKINRHPDWVTTNKERLSYCTYFTGQNLFYVIVTSFLSTYLMFCGINPLKISGVILAVKIWDAVNDALFGCIFDKIKFKSGRKFIPWLKISLIFIPLSTILMFTIPKGADEAVKLAWFAIAYLLWDTSYTFCDAPAFGVVTAMTERIDERTSLLSYKSIFAMAGQGLSFLICTVLVSEKVGASFWVAAVVLSVAGFVTMLPFCIFGKERYCGERDENFTLRKMFGYLVKNKYLLIYFLGFFFYSAAGVNIGLNMFVSYYLFHNSMFTLLIGAITVVPTLICALLVPQMLKRIDKMRLYRLCTLITVVLGLITYFAGYGNFAVFVALSALRGVPMGIIGVIMFMFTPDCAEYGKFKSGTDAKGITFALQTFMAKLTAAISTTLGLFIIGLFGWKAVEAESFADLAAQNIVQSPEALKGLWFAYALIPVLGAAIAFVIWCFYKLKDKDIQIMADCNSGKITKEEALGQITSKL